MEKEKPITLHLFRPTHTFGTRLPTQTRFPTTKRNIQSNLLLTQHFLKRLFSFSGREGERGDETEARLFITQTRETDRGEKKYPRNI